MHSLRKNKLGGLYLVADLSLPDEELLSAIGKAIRGGVQEVQIWNFTGILPEETWRLVERIHENATETGVPLIVNNDLGLAKKLHADGVHFDDLRTSAGEARKLLGSDTIVGYTCGNEKAMVRQAEEYGADYISFCAVFPSPSVQSCEIVPLASVREAKRLVSIPVFASGGITLQNAHLVLEAGADGLAIASSILRAKDPEGEARAFRQILDKYLA